MKNLTSRSILILILFSFFHTPHANALELFSYESDNQSEEYENTEEVKSREYLSFKLYDYDQFENKYILNVSGSFGNLTDENTYTDTLAYHNIFGGVYYNEYIAHQLDHLGRDTMISWTNNEGGSPNYQIKKRITKKYYTDTWRTTEERTFILDFTDLELYELEQNNYDTFGNQTSNFVQTFIPGTSQVQYAIGDSIELIFDTFNRISIKTIYNYEISQLDWIPKETREFDWNNDTLTSITFHSINFDGSLKQPQYVVRDLINLKDISQINLWKDVYNKADSYKRDIYEDNVPTALELLESYWDNGRITTTSRYQGVKGYVPWLRIAKTNFQRQLYRKMKYILPRADIRTYYEDYTESSYFEDDSRFSIYYAFRNQIEKSIVVPAAFVSDLKSTSSGDSILTITKQIYNPGTGEWQDDFMQEFVFRNVATGVEDEVKLADNIRVYPNPSNGILNVQFNGIKFLTRIDIVNSVGQTVSTEKINNFSANYIYSKDLSHFNNGIYFLQMFSENKVVSKKFILQ